MGILDKVAKLMRREKDDQLDAELAYKDLVHRAASKQPKKTDTQSVIANIVDDAGKTLEDFAIDVAHRQVLLELRPKFANIEELYEDWNRKDQRPMEIWKEMNEAVERLKEEYMARYHKASDEAGVAKDLWRAADKARRKYRAVKISPGRAYFRTLEEANGKADAEQAAERERMHAQARLQGSNKAWEYSPEHVEKLLASDDEFTVTTAKHIKEIWANNPDNYKGHVARLKSQENRNAAQRALQVAWSTSPEEVEAMEASELSFQRKVAEKIRKIWEAQPKHFETHKRKFERRAAELAT